MYSLRRFFNVYNLKIIVLEAFGNIILEMKNNSSLLSSPNITNSENQLESLEFVVEGILIPVLACLGLVGNILSITVLHSPGVDMKVNSMVINSLQNRTQIRTRQFNLANENFNVKDVEKNIK